MKQNQTGWDSIANDWFGKTALPNFVSYAPSENTLNLFEKIQGKKVLDIGCDSGHSLLYMGKHGAKELWGLDFPQFNFKMRKSYCANPVITLV